MGRKKKSKSIYIIIILVIALLLLLFYGCRHDWFVSDNTPPPDNSGEGGTPSNNQPTSQYTCYDSDGGIVWDTTGYCEDSYHSLGYADKCDEGVQTEYYCDSNGICQSQTRNCLFNQRCAAGRCQAMPCNLINPAVEANCYNGYCETGTCHFVRGGVMTPNRCEC